ncbi:MAG: hypothetical protein ACYDHH_11910 [Solirubrobacteraceae bacterium]
MPFVCVERPLESYTLPLADCGFVIEELREPLPTATAVRKHPALEDAARHPYLLHLRCRLADAA